MFRQIDVRLSQVSGVVSGVFVIAIACVLLLQVIGRNVLQYPFPWPEEVAGFLFVWLIFFGATHAYVQGGLISIDWLLEKLSPVLRGLLKLTSDLIVIAILAGLVWVGVQATQAAVGSRTTVLRFSWAWVYLAFPAGSGLLFVAFLVNLLRDVATLWRAVSAARSQDGGDQQ